jgi:hypothetical protein
MAISVSSVRSRWWSLVAVVALAACGASPQMLRPGDLAPLASQVPVEQRVAVWQRAIGVLLDEGYVPQVLNEAACYISAKQRDDVTVGAIAGTMTIVTVSPEGVLRVQVSGAGVYNSQAELARDLDAIQHRLVQEISSPGGAPARPGTPGAPPAS